MTKINTLLRDSSMTVALIVTVALLLWMTGLPMMMNTARAAALTTVSDTLSDSDLSASADHTIVFTTPTGIAVDALLVITFAGAFGTTAIDYDDIDLAVSGVGDVTLAASPTGSTWGAVMTSDVLTFTNGNAAVAAGKTITIEIGDHSSQGDGATQITNPSSAGTVSVVIGGGFGDTGTAMVAIIDDVVVSASVGTSFTFVISGVNSGVSGKVNGEGDSGGTVDVTTSATAIPWGSLTATSDYLAAQKLAVTTNASNGYSVVLVMDQALTSSAGDTIDFFVDGSGTTDDLDWAAPATTIGSVATYGHMGFTSDDADITAADVFASGFWAGDALAGNHIVLHNSGPSDGSTQNSGMAHVGFRIETSALQEAGSDYTAQLTYIATPIF